MRQTTTVQTAARHPGTGRYLVVWLALAAMTVLTWALHFVKLGGASLPVAMLIAGTKTLLVLLFFMHLIEHRGASALAVGVSFAFIALLVALVLGDAGLRFPAASPPDSDRGRPYFERRLPDAAGHAPGERERGP